MSDLDDDLHVTADAIEADAARIQAIEQEKSMLDADNPRTVGLSVESDRIARAMVPKTKAELDIANEATGDEGSAGQLT
jgi:hypothetical protein